MSSTAFSRQQNQKLVSKKVEIKKNVDKKLQDKKQLDKKQLDKKQLDAKKQEKRKKLEAKKQNDLDFVIFCDENDELTVKAVEKENLQQNKKLKPNGELAVEDKKKKGLSDRNAPNLGKQKKITSKVSKKENIQHKDKTQSSNVKNLVDQKKKKGLSNRNFSNVQGKKSETNVSKENCNELGKENNKNEKREALVDIKDEKKEKLKNVNKENIKNKVITDEILNEIGQESIISIHNLKLDESVLSDENIIDESLFSENKENDPTLMSIDFSKVEIENQEKTYKDVSGDLSCKDFSNEIYCYMLEREKKLSPNSDYMSKQPEITSKMRAMLIDWLIDVGIEYELDNETVFLAINYIDRFLSILTISLQNFQLLGTAALFIASKYEDIYPPDVKEFIYVTDDAYTKGQMLSMEKLILKSLQFDISPPTPLYFLKYFLTKLTLPTYVEYFAEYICFLSLLETEPFLSFLPSDIAISSIIMALHTYSLHDIVNIDEFKKLASIHSHTDDEGNISDEKAIFVRQNCVNAMYEMQKNITTSAQQSVYTKYSSEKYLSVANVEIADEIPLIFFYLL